MNGPDPRGPGRFHYAGIGGSGMSALAQFQVMTGGLASGSDRSFDRGERAAARAQLERLGISIFPQNGSGVEGACAALVVSTAVEDEVADVATAKKRGIPIIHRSEMLAHYVRSNRTIAVAGTSGKSTVVAMTFEILRGAGRSPSVITGGELLLLEAEGLWGNAWYGGNDLLVVEADESDGSLVRYEPEIGVVLNLQRDHRETAEVAEMFATFRSNTGTRFVTGEDSNLASLAADATVFGFGESADVRAEEVELGAAGSRFEVDGVPIAIPVPGRHNVANALAAIAACQIAGVPIADMAAPIAGYQGVGRRFQVVGRVHGIEVVDDFAHNPAKIAAVLTTARARTSGDRVAIEADPMRPAGASDRVTAAPGVRAGRVLAIYQPHGYGPTRFLRRDFVETFATCLGPEDRLWMLEVFYAGGTATRDFSAADLIAEIVARGRHAAFAPSRDALIASVAAEARPGDLVLLMGARDPSLSDLAKALLDAIAARDAHALPPIVGTT